MLADAALARAFGVRPAMREAFGPAPLREMVTLREFGAWFDAPRNRVLENRLKAGLTAFGCDPKVFTYSQPVRVPGCVAGGEIATVGLVEGVATDEHGIFHRRGAKARKH
jgi:hypothetical protein